MALGNNPSPNEVVKEVKNLGTNKADKDLNNVTYPTNTLGSTTTGSGDRIIRRWCSSDGNSFSEEYKSGKKRYGGYHNPTTYSWTNEFIQLPSNFFNKIQSIQVTEHRGYASTDTWQGFVTSFSTTSFSVLVYKDNNQGDFWYIVEGY